MNIYIPPGLIQRVQVLFGASGTTWREELPERIADSCRAWRLTPAGPFGGGNTCSWVAPVECESGETAVLKINYPERESLLEAGALKAIGGRGAVRLLRSSDDGLCLLLERCHPGSDLWQLGIEEGDGVAAGILRRLWAAPPGVARFHSTACLVEEWVEELPRNAPAAGYPEDLIAEALRLARTLEVSQHQTVLLHGDFHPGNVLSAEREPWLAIDPKPMLGEPAYDLAQWLGNRCEAARGTRDATAALRAEIHRLSARLDLDPARVAGWAFVKSVGWDFGPEVARMLYDAIEE